MAMRPLADLAAKHKPAAGTSIALSILPFVGAFVLALVFREAIGPMLGKTWAKIFVDVGIAIVLAGSLNVVNGLAGQFSIGHAGFMLAGAYASAWLTFYGSIHIWGNARLQEGFLGGGELLFLASCVLAGVIAAIFGVIVGLPSLRLRGDYLAIVTLGFGEIVRVIGQITSGQVTTAKTVENESLLSLVDNLGGSKGFIRIPHYTDLFFVYLFAFVLLILAYRLKYSSRGRALLAVRENEVAAEAVGVDTTRVKVAAFIMSAFFGGIGGALYAHHVTVVNPGELAFQKSIDLVIIVVIGGMGSITGVVLGAVILTILPEVFRDFSEYRMIAYAMALILVMLLRPQGIMGVKELWETSWWKRLVDQVRRR